MYIPSLRGKKPIKKYRAKSICIMGQLEVDGSHVKWDKTDHYSWMNVVTINTRYEFYGRNKYHTPEPAA